MSTATYPPIEIAKPGRAVATNGAVVEFTSALLADLAESYDPMLHVAPLVVGHPALDAPAYGSVGQVVYHAATERVEAIPSEVYPAFAEAVRDRAYRAVSLSMYLPDSPSNPKPGHHYLRHVGFLGAHPPAIKGLRPVAFGAAEEGVLEFGEGEWAMCSAVRGVLGMLGNVRDWLIGREGPEQDDKIIPRESLDWAASSLAEAEAAEQLEHQADSAAPLNYSEATVTTVTTETDETTAAFAEREAALAAREARLAEQEKAAEAARCLDFAETLVREGRLLPRDKAGCAAFLGSIPPDGTLEFGEGDAAVQTTGRAWLEDWLRSLPRQVDFGEFDRGGSEELGAANSDAAIARRARAYHAAQAAAGAPAAACAA